MKLSDIIKPFSITHEGTIYKVSHDHTESVLNKDTEFLAIENVLTGETIISEIRDYSPDSGNAHLIGSLEEFATQQYVRRGIIAVFGIDPEDERRSF